MLLAKNRQIDYTKYINYTIIIYAFILPLSRAAIVFFSGVLILLWILEGDFKRKYLLLSRSKIILALLVFIAFNLISLFWTDDISTSLNYIKKYWYFSPLIPIMTSIKKEYILKALSAFILGMLLSEIIAYGVFFEVWTFKHVTPQNPTPFMHHIEYSVFLAFTALVLLSRIFAAGNRKYKYVYMIFFITINGNLFLTAGRTGQLALILGLFVLAIISFKNKLKALLVSSILTVLLIGLAFTFSSTFHDRISTGIESLVHVAEGKNYCTSWGSRVGVWVVSKDIIEEHPMIGIGIIDNMQEFYRLLNTEYQQMICEGNTLVHMHNQYLQILTQLGSVGLFIFLSIFYMIAKLKIKHEEYRKIKYIYLTVLSFAFISEVILHRQFGMALFALIVGLLLAQNRVENEI